MAVHARWSRPPGADVIPYAVDPVPAATLGLIVLRADETIESEFRAMLPPDTHWLTSRIDSGAEVTSSSLAAMEARLTLSACLFPDGMAFDVIGYACTSGTAQIGADRVAAQIKAGAHVQAVTDPVTALVAACQALDVARINILSPYVPTVSTRLCEVLASQGLTIPHVGSFDIAREAIVARISAASLVDGGVAVMGSAPADALFISCTNLRTLAAIPRLEDMLDRPVLTSNQVLAWHMQRIAGLSGGTIPGRLGQI